MSESLNIKEIKEIYGRTYGFSVKGGNSGSVYLKCILIRHHKGLCLVESLGKIALEKGDMVVCDSRNNRSRAPQYSFEKVSSVENDWIFTIEQPDVGQNSEWMYKLLVKYYEDSKVIITNRNNIPFHETLDVWVACKETEEYKKAKEEAVVFALEQRVKGRDYDENYVNRLVDLKETYGLEYEIITDNDVDAFAVNDDIFLLNEKDCKRIMADLTEVDRKVGVPEVAMTEIKLAIKSYIDSLKGEKICR